MMQMRAMSRDLFWWLLAAMLGLLALWLPQFLGMELKPDVRILMGALCLFVFSGVIGFLKPEHAWRWGVASVLLFPVKEMLEFAATTGSIVASFPYLMLKLPVYALQTIPGLLGAYIGAILNNSAPPKVRRQVLNDNDVRPETKPDGHERSC
jgi:hypothetical protein